MNRSLTVLWTALLLAILAVIIVSKFWLVQRERATAERVRELLSSRLSSYDTEIAKVFENISLNFEQITSSIDVSNSSDCVELSRHPLVRTLVVIDRQTQQLAYPSDISAATLDERGVIEEALQLLRDRNPKLPNQNQRLYNYSIFTTRREQIAQTPSQAAFKDTAQSQPKQDAANQAVQAQNSVTQPSVPQQSEVSQSGNTENPMPLSTSDWVTWYHRRGMMLGYLWQQDKKWEAMIVLPRARWVSDIVASLPDTQKSTNKITFDERSLKQIVDVEGHIIHQWSSLPQEDWKSLSEHSPDAEISVAAPLEGWRIREFVTPAYRQTLAGEDQEWLVWLAVGTLSMSLLLAGVFVTTNMLREVRLARSRVSFVNQVSHELRTPLTNICMYADLMAQSIPDEDLEDEQHQLQQERLNVIRSESMRLSRLINNVLAFARPNQSQKLTLQPVVLDRLVEEVLATFEPRFEELQLKVEKQLSAPETREIDRDIAEQILINLISNAEKYGASGKLLRVETSSNGDEFEFKIIDEGPGIPEDLRNKIFQPFVRASDAIVAPAGTGIGLTIARELAIRHGGSCELLPSTKGATFRCVLRASRVS